MTTIITMKKFLFGAAALLLMASCSGNGTSEKKTEDSTRIADSIAQVETTRQAEIAAEQARLDSIRQDSIAKVEKTAQEASQYDDLVNQYAALVNKLDKEARSGNFNNMYSKVTKITNLEAKIRKVKNNLSPEQLKKYKKALNKMSALGNGIIAG